MWIYLSTGEVRVNVKSLCLTKHHDVKTYWGGRTAPRVLNLSVILELSGQLHAPSTLLPWEELPSTHWTMGLVGPRAGLDAIYSEIDSTLRVM
jgi:hypothetical protein